MKQVEQGLAVPCTRMVVPSQDTRCIFRPSALRSGLETVISAAGLGTGGSGLLRRAVSGGCGSPALSSVHSLTSVGGVAPRAPSSHTRVLCRAVDACVPPDLLRCSFSFLSVCPYGRGGPTGVQGTGSASLLSSRSILRSAAGSGPE